LVRNTHKALGALGALTTCDQKSLKEIIDQIIG